MWLVTWGTTAKATTAARPVAPRSTAQVARRGGQRRARSQPAAGARTDASSRAASAGTTAGRSRLATKPASPTAATTTRKRQPSWAAYSSPWGICWVDRAGSLGGRASGGLRLEPEQVWGLRYQACRLHGSLGGCMACGERAESRWRRPRDRQGGLPHGSCESAGWPRLGSHLRERDGHRSAGVRAAFNRDGSGVGLDEALYDGEADPASRNGRGLRAPPKAFEDVCQLLVGDAGAGIGDGDVGRAVVLGLAGAGLDLHAAASRRELEGVRQQVAGDLVQPIGI